MNPQTTKVKNGKIMLPKQLRRAWEKAEVFITGEKDTLLIKRLKSPSFTEMLNEFRKIGKNISKKDVEEAIKWVRRKEEGTRR